LSSDAVVTAAAGTAGRRGGGAAGVEKHAAVLDDPAWDEAVRDSHETAMKLAGPGIGSPVLQIESATRGLHGPIVTETPSLEDGPAIWDATAALIKIDYFFEVKRGRS
jgi:hypothetical protein